MKITKDSLDKYFEERKRQEDIDESNKRGAKMAKELRKLETENSTSVLIDDIKNLFDLTEIDNSQSNKRSLIRSVFAYIEGEIHMMKQWIFIIESHKRKPILSEKEFLLLKEKTYYVDDKGKIRDQVKFIKISSNIIFTLKCFCKVYGIYWELNKNDDGWKALLKTIKVRNRITHPKYIADLDISDEEEENLYEAFKYYAVLMDNIWKKAKINIEKELKSNKLIF